MRVTVFEGTPDEVRKFFPHLANGQVGVVEQAVEAPAGAQPAFAAQLLERARPENLDAVRHLADEVASWPSVRVAIGERRGGEPTGYLRFHRIDGAASAFAYLYPRRGYARAHLPAETFAGARHAKRRGGRAANGEWSHNLMLYNPEALEEALGFVRRAYELAAE